MFSRLEGDLYLPGRDTFAELPGLVLKTFAGVDESAPFKVLFVLIDGLGSALIEPLKTIEPEVQRLFNLGKERRLSAQFPSTTTAEITSFFFNLPVGEHGLYEWQIYEPLCDALFLTLPYVNLHQGSLPDVDKLLPYRNIFEQLTDLGISSVVCSPQEYLKSPYNRAAVRGAKYAGYNRLTWPTVLKDAITAMSDRCFLYFYFPYVDEAGHMLGPESKAAAEEARAICCQISMLIESQPVDRWFVTADHGMVSVNPADTIRLDWEFPWLLDKIERTGSGRFMAPVGSERDLFLHTKDASEVAHRLREGLKGRAAVYQSEELMVLGAFGSRVSARLLERVGDVVVLPYEGYSVWMLEGLSRRGQHGGLSRKELEITLLSG